jgi:hypothetical protein
MELYGFVQLFPFPLPRRFWCFRRSKVFGVPHFRSSGILYSVEGECYRFPRCHWQFIHQPQHRIVVSSEEIFTQAKRENFEIPDSLHFDIL